MCGRYSLSTTPERIAEVFGLQQVLDLEPRYNIAPTQPVPAVRARRGADDRELSMLAWGLIPSWADDPSIGNRMINARAETVAEKPSYRSAFKQRRCLVVADGFYEWKRAGTAKVPFLIRRRDGSPFGFAGLWERWERPDRTIESCAIITTQPNELMAPIHDRMPVIVDPADFDLWLDAKVRATDKLEALLKPFPAGELVAFPVSKRVNSPSNDDPGLQEPAAED